MAATSVAGLAMQASAAKKAANAAKGAERNYLREMQTALQAQETIQPKLLSLERMYRPQWLDFEGEMLSRQIGLARLAQQNASSDTGLKAMDMAQQMSPAYSYMGQQAMQNYRQMLGPEAAGLMAQLRAKAMNDMASGGALSKEEADQINQATRAGMASRGMQMGNQAAAMEALAQYGQMEKKTQAAQAQGMMLYQLAQQEVPTAWQMYTPGVDAMVRSQADPRYLTGLAQAIQATAGPQVFQPESQYSAGVYGANAQNTVSANLAAAQARAGMGAGLMSAGASLGAAYLGNPNTKIT